MNEASVSCRHPNVPATSVTGQIPCVVTRNLRLDVDNIQEYSVSRLTLIEQDWALLTAVVAFSDRKISRRRASGWKRTIKVSLPVSDPAMWSNDRVCKPLQDLLNCLTGDHWRLRFTDGFQSIAENSSYLDLEPIGLNAVMPVSDGMDSLVQSNCLRGSSSKTDVVRFHVNMGSPNSSNFSKIQPHRMEFSDLVTVSLRLKVGNHPESTYRTRPLLFFGLAGLLALKTGTSQVIVGENGVSSIGPRLIAYGGEHYLCGTHPVFTRQLSGVLRILFNKEIQFVHPNLFKTKGQMLASMEPQLRANLLMTRSCVRDSRDQFGNLPCGLCSGCLYRRVSLAAADIKEDCYHWSDLSGPTLEQCQPPESDRPVTDNDRGLASHAIHSLESFAQLANLSSNDSDIQRAAFEIAHCDSSKIPMISSRIVKLIGHHAKEWNAFKERFSEGSILRTIRPEGPRGEFP